MPPCCSSVPRKKLPPPITTATWVPVATTSAICRATARTTTGSTPTAPPPNISPPSLSTARRKSAGAATVPAASIPASSITWSGLADLEPRELPDRDTGLVQQRLHGLLGVLHRGLLQQHDVLVEPVEPTLDDAREHLLGLA